MGSQVLAEVDDGSKSYVDLKEHHDTLDHNFWLLGRHTLLQRHFPVFSEDAVFKLFRIFCLLADRSSEKKGLIQVLLFSFSWTHIKKTSTIIYRHHYYHHSYHHIVMSSLLYHFVITKQVTGLDSVSRSNRRFCILYIYQDNHIIMVIAVT